MNKSIGISMTVGTPWKHTLRFALPVLAGSLLQQLYNTVDTIIVGNVSGEASLAAVGTTGSFVFLFLAIAMGFSAGSGVVVAQHYGAADQTRVRENAAVGILFLMTLGIVITVIGIVVSRPAFIALVAVPEQILDLTLLYFRISMLGMIFTFGYNIISSILRAVGDSAATLYFLLIASVMNILLDLLFVAGFHWGVAGAAIATDVSQFASFIAAYIYMIGKYPIFRFNIKDYKWDWSLIRKTVIVGFPISLQLIIVSLGLTFIQRAVNSFGHIMTAAFTVGQRVEMYMNLPCNAFQTTLATYTGQNIGANLPNRVKSGAMQTLLMSLIMTVLISVLVWIFAPQIAALFGTGENAAGYAVEFVRAIAVCNILLSVYIPLFGVFQGTGHGGAATLVAICALTVRVFVTYLLKSDAFLGHHILWWNGIFGFGVGCTVTWTYYLSGRWKNQTVINK